MGLASYDTLITTITATTIIISTEKNIFATVSETIGAVIQWMFCYGFKYTISRIRLLLFNTWNVVGKKISLNKEFRTNIQCGSIRCSLREGTKVKLWKNCQRIVATTVLHNNNVVNMKKTLLDNEDI